MQIKVLSILVPCSEIYHEKYLGYTGVEKCDN